MDITIKPEKVKEIEKYIKEFSKQKAIQEEDIRAYDVVETDLYKDLLLEEYFSGMIVVLRACGIDFILDDKLSDVDILIPEKEIVCKIDDKFKKLYLNARNEISELLNCVMNTHESNQLFEFEKMIHGKFYMFLGSYTLLNKLGVKISVNNLFNENSLYEFFTQIDSREVTDYINISNDINELINYVYEKFNILKILSITEWRKNISSIENNVLTEITKVISDNAPQEALSNAQKRQDLFNNKINDIDDMLVDLNEELIMKEANHQHELMKFANKYFNIE